MLRQLAEPEPVPRRGDEQACRRARGPREGRPRSLPDPHPHRQLCRGTGRGRLPEWPAGVGGRITALISDDADFDDAWAAMPGDKAAGRLRRGDVASFAATTSEILVAPLLAVERGHNIVLPGGKAAIGTVYFLARPHPRPDDITLAIQAVNDWAVRHVRDGGFAQQVRAVGSLDAAGLAFRKRARAEVAALPHQAAVRGAACPRKRRCPSPGTSSSSCGRSSAASCAAASRPASCSWTPRSPPARPVSPPPTPPTPACCSACGKCWPPTSATTPGSTRRSGPSSRTSTSPCTRPSSDLG